MSISHSIALIVLTRQPCNSTNCEMIESKNNSNAADEEDDRINTLQTSNTTILSPRSLAMSGIQNLDLSSGSGFQDAGEEAGENEDEILVVFELPDGSQTDNKFRLGQTVEVLKSFCESEFGIPMQTCVLRLKSKVMMDPLSLLDFPEIKGWFFSVAL